jgi:hypothetical protein
MIPRTNMRLMPVVVLLAAALLLSACTSSDSGTATPDDPSGTSSEAGCGDCVEELADVRSEIEALPDVRELLTLETYRESPTNGAGVRVELRTRSTGDAAVVDEVGRIVWQSRLAPVDEVFVTVEDASGELVRGSSPLDFTDTGRRHDTYVEQWGERPVTR